MGDSSLESQVELTEMDIIREQEKLDEELSLDIASRMQSTCYRLCTENVYRPNFKNLVLSNSQSGEIHTDKKLKVDEKDCLDNCAFKYLTAQRYALEYVNKVTQENMLKQQQLEEENGNNVGVQANAGQVNVESLQNPKKKRFFGLF